MREDASKFSGGNVPQALTSASIHARTIADAIFEKDIERPPPQADSIFP
jgi:hypothetical protein